MPKAEETKKAEDLVVADELTPLLLALLQADPQAKVRVHDQNWLDVALSPARSGETILRALRGIAEGLKEQTAKKARRKELLAAHEKAFAARLPKEAKSGVTLCLLEGPKLFIDAVPSALKVYLRDLAAELGNVPASTATMVRGICADLRAAPDYVPNR